MAERTGAAGELAMVTLSIARPDGSLHTRTWPVQRGTVVSLARMLGTPEIESIDSPEAVAAAAAAMENHPGYLEIDNGRGGGDHG